MGCIGSKDKGDNSDGGTGKKGGDKGNTPAAEEPKRYKFVLIGNPDVGKTSIFHRFATDKWLADHPDENDECVTQVRTIEVNGKKVIIDLWDTAGQEKYRTITSSFYQQCVGALLLFDICSKSSFDVLPDWLVEARRYGREATLLLVGNKSDRSGEREVPKEDAIALARKNQIEYVETSAKTGDGVLLAFQTLSKLIMKGGDDDNRLGDSDGGD